MSQQRKVYYEFIQVDGTRRTSITPALFTPRNRLKRVHQLDITFEAVTEIHIGSGVKGMKGRGVDGLIHLAMRDATGTLYIPGSTIKGVVSTNYLALSGSSEETSECFGTTVRRRGRGPAVSKVFFSDAKPQGPVQPCWRGINRPWTPSLSKRSCIKVYTAKAPSTKPYGKVECIPPGILLRTSILGVEMRSHELGGLLMSLGLAPGEQGMKLGFLKIGYGKPQGMGLLRVQPNNSLFRIKTVKNLTVEEKETPLLSSTCLKLMREFVDKGRREDRDVMDVWGKLFGGIGR